MLVLSSDEISSLVVLKTGSVHSVLKFLPLLDNLQEDTDKVTCVFVVVQRTI